jgi:leucyl aminopeptidase
MVSSSRLGSKSSRKHKTSPSQLNAIAYATESNRTIANIIDNANDADTASEEEETPVNVLLVSKAQFPEWKKGVANESVDLLQTLTGVNVNNFPGTRIVNVPNDKTVTQVAFYDEKAVAKKSFRVFDGYWSQLKNKTYALSAFAGAEIEAEVANKLALSFALSTYRMNYFKKGGKAPSNTKLIWPSTCDKGYVRNVARAYTLMKDLSDTPAMDCGPAELGDAAVAIGNELGASKIEVTVGVDNLIKNNYSQIAAVGMAASSGREPRIVDIEWNSGTDTASADESTPQIVIVGKGVTFDTGGLNIKGGGGMRSMKRDMSGAAQVCASSQALNH